MIMIEERFSAALHHTSRAWRSKLDARLRDLGVGQAGWMAIAIVAKSARPLSQRMLAEQLAVEAPTVVANIHRLGAAGLIVRVPCEIDRRVKLVQLTAAGHALYGRVRIEADAFCASTLSQFDGAALRSATKILEELGARFESAPCARPH